MVVGLRHKGAKTKNMRLKARKNPKTSDGGRMHPFAICAPCWGGHGERCQEETDPEGICGCFCRHDGVMGDIPIIGAGPAYAAADWCIMHATRSELMSLQPWIHPGPWWLS